MREELVNRVSKDILEAHGTDWDTVFLKVNGYAELLEGSVRNFYELQMENSGCPLFTLCHFKKEGKDCFGYTEEEFAEVIGKIEKEVNEKFSISF